MWNSLVEVPKILEDFFFTVRKSIVEELRTRYNKHQKKWFGFEEELYRISSSTDIVEGSELWKAVNKVHSMLELFRGFLTHLDENLLRMSEKDEKFNQTILASLQSCDLKNIETIAESLSMTENEHCIKLKANPEDCCEKIFNIVGNAEADTRHSNISQIKDDADKLIKKLNTVNHLIAKYRFVVDQTSTGAYPKLTMGVPFISETAHKRLKAILKTGFKQWYSDAFQNIALYISQIHYCNLATQNVLLTAKNLSSEQN